VADFQPSIRDVDIEVARAADDLAAIVAHDKWHRARRSRMS
jgi:hypothetical protein